MFPVQPPRDQRLDDAAPDRRAAYWKLEDAKARFSEVVKLAERGTPQHVSVRGRPAVVVLSMADYARLAPAATRPSLASLFADSPFTRLDDFDDVLVRERSPVRDAPVFDP
jgi:prevent-host-death family protein